MSSSTRVGPGPASLPVPAQTPGGAPRARGTTPGVGGSLSLLALFGLSQIGVALGFSLLLRTFPGLAGAESPHAVAVKLGMPVTVIASHLITWLGIYFLVMRWHGASFIRELRLEKPARRPMMLALGGGVGLQILGALLVWLIPPPPDYVPPLRDFLLLGTWAIALLFLFAVLMAPLLEEVLFRGLLFSALRRRYAFPFSALVATLLFTAMHLGQSGGYWPPLVGIAACGWFLALWRERSGSLWPPIAFHFAFNLTALLPIIVLSLLGYPIDQLALG